MARITTHAARLREPHNTSPDASVEEGKSRLLQRKETIDAQKRQKKAAVARRAWEVLRKIEVAIGRVDQLMAASPSQGDLSKLSTNYRELESKARAITQLMSNPHDHIEEHSIEDHHDTHHEASFETLLHDFHGHSQEVHVISGQARKLFQQEPEYLKRSHPHGTWASRQGQMPENQAR